MKLISLMLLSLFFSASVLAETRAYSFYNSVNGKNINYLVYTPKFYMKKSPLLVFLHGAGEKPQTDIPLYAADIERLKKHGPSKHIANQTWSRSLPFIVVSIQCYQGCKFHHPKIVNEVINQVKAKISIDKKRVYLTGISMGGNGVMRYIAKYPKSVAAVVPIAGYGAGNWCAYNQTAYWGFHNSGDEIVSVAGTTEAYKKLKNCGKRSADTEMHIFKRAGHDSWTDIYDLSAGYDIYSWFLYHSLP